MSDAGWVHPGPISPLDCDQAGCGWRVHGVPDKYHANALARHVAEAHQPVVDVNARDEAVEMIRRICPAHLDADWYGQFLAEKFDAYRAEVLREAADLISSAQEQIERDEITKHAFLDHETVLQRDAVHDMAKLLRRMATEATS